MSKKHTKDIIVYFILLLPAILLFWHILFSYFSQDDFYHLRVIMDKNWSEIPSFFVTWQEGQTFFRPLSREIFNLIMYQSFGLNPLPFHIVNFLLILFSGGLIFLLVKKISTKFPAALLALFLYSVSAVHSIQLYYLASVQTLMSTTFMMLSILFYPQKYLLSLLWFILALLCHETAIVLPAILLSLKFTLERKTFLNKDTLLPLGLFFIIGMIHLFSTSLFKNLPSQLAYQPVLSIKSIINSFGWYLLWSFGLPEMLADFVGPKLLINPNLIKWHGQYFKIVLPSLGGLLILLVIFVAKFYQNIGKEKFLLVTIPLYLISLAPLLLFPQHKFIYYLSFPIIWFSISLGLILSYAIRSNILYKILVILFLCLFVIISYQTTKLSSITHWAAKRSRAARYLITDLKRNYPTVTRGAIFYFKDDVSYPVIAKDWGTSSKQAFYILSGADGLKLLYQDPTIKAYFEGMGGLPQDIDMIKVIKFVAKFPY